MILIHLNLRTHLINLDDYAHAKKMCVVFLMNHFCIHLAAVLKSNEFSVYIFISFVYSYIN